MAKHTYHFKHDFNAHNDEKILDLRMDHGMEGYGIYWYLIEMLANAEEYKLSNNYKRLAFTMRTEEGTLKSIIEEYDLFIVENGLFWSNSLVDRMSKLDELKKRRSEAGKKGAEAKLKQSLSKPSAKVQKVVANSNRVKESKVKESKEDNSKEIKRDILSEYLAIWNDSQYTTNYSPISSEVKKQLKKKITARENDIDGFKEKLTKVINSPFDDFTLSSSWFCFEWCFKSSNNAEKLLTGKYNNAQMVSVQESIQRYTPSPRMLSFISNRDTISEVPEELIEEYKIALKNMPPEKVEWYVNKFGTLEE